MAVTLAAPAYPQESAKPNESPWAMHAPTAAPQGAPTLSAEEVAAIKKAEQGDTGAAGLRAQGRRRDGLEGLRRDEAAVSRPSTVKCIGKNQDFLQDRLNRQFALPISQKFKLTITTLPPNIMNPSKYSTYPLTADSFDDHGVRPRPTPITTRLISLSARKPANGTSRSHVRPTPGWFGFAKLQKDKELGHEHAKTGCGAAQGSRSSRSCSRLSASTTPCPRGGSA